MLIKIQFTTLLQIFCELMIIFKVILPSIQGPEETCQGDNITRHEWVNPSNAEATFI